MLTPLTLGAAAIGQSYGIANPAETMSNRSAWSVLDRCWEAGIRSIDTAAAYGDAEDRIGRWRADRAVTPVVISKAPPLVDVPDDEVAGALDRFIDASRSKLGVTAIDGYLLHDACDWRRAPVRAALQAAKTQGGVRAVGVSGYDANEMLDLLAIDCFDMLQIPLSIFDRRAEASGLLDRTRNLGVVVFARSVFLQGLLFLDPADLAPAFRPAAPPLAKLRALAAEAGCDLTAIAIRAAAETHGVASVVVGLYSAAQVDQAVAALIAPVEKEVIAEAVAIAGTIPADLRDPRRWPAA
jgi:aryl-alcohol dehydrogenase-like predicted oxidoreductase